MEKNPERISLRCSRCQAKLSVRKDLDKTQIECPRCSATISLPTENQSPEVAISELTLFGWGLVGALIALAMWLAALTSGVGNLQRGVSGMCLAVICLIGVIIVLQVVDIIAVIILGSPPDAIMVRKDFERVPGWMLKGASALAIGFGVVLGASHEPHLEKYPRNVIMYGGLLAAALGWLLGYWLARRTKQ